MGLMRSRGASASGILRFAIRVLLAYLIALPLRRSEIRIDQLIRRN